MRLDEAVDAGSGFVVIARGFDPAAALDRAAHDALAMVGTRYLALSTPGAGPGARDVDGRLDAFLDARGWTAMIVRPDFYVYGGAADRTDLAMLANALMNDLAAAGLRVHNQVVAAATA